MQEFKWVLWKPITDERLNNYIKDLTSKVTPDSEFLDLKVGDNLVIEFKTKFQDFKLDFSLVIPNTFSIIRSSADKDELFSWNQIVEEGGVFYEIETSYPKPLLEGLWKLYVYSVFKDEVFANEFIEWTIKGLIRWGMSEDEYNRLSEERKKEFLDKAKKWVTIAWMSLYKTSIFSKSGVNEYDFIYKNTFSKFPEDEDFFSSISIQWVHRADSEKYWKKISELIKRTNEEIK